jgi:hypothetical protein
MAEWLKVCHRKCGHYTEYEKVSQPCTVILIQRHERSQKPVFMMFWLVFLGRYICWLLDTGNCNVYLWRDVIQTFWTCALLRSGTDNRPLHDNWTSWRDQNPMN